MANTDVTTLSTACPSMTFSNTGVTAPDLTDVLAGSLTDMKTALGSDMGTSLTSPQGQLAMALAAIIGSKNDEFLALVNNLNPDTSKGRFQDAIGKIYFIEREAAQGTTVTATCTGLVGAVIPAGSYAQDTNGYIYASIAAATIGPNGSVDVVFTNTQFGPIECPVGALSIIYKTVDGWSGITNNNAGVVGRDVESPSAFETRRKLSVAKNSKHTDASVLGALLAIDNVVDAYVISNNTTTTVSKGTTNVEIPQGTMYIACYGGDSTSIANAIYNKINPGCATQCSSSNNNLAIQDTVNYPTSNHSYTYYWTSPKPTPVYIKVELENNNQLSNTITNDTQNALIKSFSGGDDGPSARIGSTLYAGRYYGNISKIDPQNINILSISLSVDGVNYSNSIELGIDQIPTLSLSNIAVSLK